MRKSFRPERSFFFFFLGGFFFFLLSLKTFQQPVIYTSLSPIKRSLLIRSHLMHFYFICFHSNLFFFFVPCICEKAADICLVVKWNVIKRKEFIALWEFEFCHIKTDKYPHLLVPGQNLGNSKQTSKPSKSGNF